MVVSRIRSLTPKLVCARSSCRGSHIRATGELTPAYCCITVHQTLPNQGGAVDLASRQALTASGQAARQNQQSRTINGPGGGTGLSVPGHALRCGPDTSVTSPLRWRWVELSGHERTYIQPSRPWECGNPEGISNISTTCFSLGTARPLAQTAR